MNNEAERAAVSVEEFGGLVAESQPSDIPSGASALTWDTDFAIGSVRSRDGLQTVLNAGDALNFNFVKTYAPTSGKTKTLALDNAGTLWTEDINASEGTLSSFFAGLAPGSFCKSVTQFEREWMVFSDLKGGTDVPRQFNNTTNFDRISQVGPGTPPSLSTSANTYSLALSPTGITQPPVGVTTTAGKFQFVNWADSATGRQPGNVLTIFYAQTQTPQNTALKPGVIVELTGLTTENLFPAGTYIIIATGADKPASDASRKRWWFSVQTATTGNLHTRNGPDVEVGQYEITLATVTTVEPIPGVVVGSSITITGADVAAWNNTWVVTGTLNSGQFQITQSSITSGVATYGFNVVTGTAPAPGEQVTVTGCYNGATVGGNSVLNVTNALVTAVTGTSSSGTFSISIVAADVSVAAETGAAITSGTQFTIDPGLSHLGAATDMGYTSPIFGHSGGIASPPSGSITVGGDIVGGVRQAVTIFKTRTGYLTAPSIPVVFATPGGSKLSVSNIAIGPPNVIARIIALTGADGGNFFWIPNPVTVTGVGQNKTYDATIINDNTTTSVELDFTDDILLAASAIDVQGENLFNLIELGDSVWNVAYGARMFYGGEENKLQNLTNTTFDGGYVLANPDLPAGWARESLYSDGGALGVSPVFGNSYMITNNTGLDITAWSIASNVATFTCTNTYVAGQQLLLGGFTPSTFFNGQNITVTGSTGTAFTAAFTHAPGSATEAGRVSNAYTGWITQAAFQDYYQAPILQINKTYSARVSVRKTTSFSGGLLRLSLSSPQFAVTYGTADINVASMTTSMTRFIVPLMTTAFTNEVPKDLVLNLLAVNVPDGDAVELDRFEIFRDDEPQLATEVQGSYVIDPESFDGVTGVIGLAQENNQPCYGAFVQYDLMYFLKSGSMFSTADVPRSEPSGWTVKEVSNKVGTAGPLAYDSGEEWMITACRPGVYLFAGSEPFKLSQELQPLWDMINWKYGHTIWVKNDIQARRVLIGVPLPTPNPWLPNDATNANPTTPNVVLMMSYKELNTALALAEHPPIHIAYSGKLVSWDQSRKWSIWHVASPSADFITRSTTEKPLLVCNGLETGKIYEFADRHDDDGAGINSLYTTYGFVQTEQETQSPLLGNFRKLYNYVTMNIRGAGRAVIKALPNILNPRHPYTVPGGAYLIDDTNTEGANCPDVERPLNVTANRCFVQISTSGAGNWFQLSKLTMSIVKDPWSPVAGRALASGVAVAITPSPTTATVMGTRQLTATVTGTTNQAVTWTVVGTLHGTVSATGLYTAPASPGTYTVTATSVADPLKSKTVTVVVS